MVKEDIKHISFMRVTWFLVWRTGGLSEAGELNECNAMAFWLEFQRAPQAAVLIPSRKQNHPHLPSRCGEKVSLGINKIKYITTSLTFWPLEFCGTREAPELLAGPTPEGWLWPSWWQEGHTIEKRSSHQFSCIADLTRPGLYKNTYTPKILSKILPWLQMTPFYFALLYCYFSFLPCYLNKIEGQIIGFGTLWPLVCSDFFFLCPFFPSSVS